MDHLIVFDSMQWDSPAEGLRFKKFTEGNKQIRLVEFSEGFTEEEWCRTGHIGHVLDGAFSINYSGKTENYNKGDVIFIPDGDAHKHKAIVGKGEKVLLLLVETL